MENYTVEEARLYTHKYQRKYITNEHSSLAAKHLQRALTMDNISSNMQF